MEDDVTAPADTQDTPVTEAPDQGHAPQQDEPGHDWEKRYNDLRPQFDRTNQQLKEVEPLQQWWGALQSEDTRAQAIAELAQMIGPEAMLEALGYEADGQQADEPQDPAQQMMSEWEQFKSQQAQLQEQQAADALEQSINTEIDQLAEQHGLNLDAEAKELLFTRVLTLPPKADNTPDVEQAFKALTGLRDAWIGEYRQSKGAPAPPAKPGSSGEPTVDLSNPKARNSYALQVAEEAFHGSS